MSPLFTNFLVSNNIYFSFISKPIYFLDIEYNIVMILLFFIGLTQLHRSFIERMLVEKSKEAIIYILLLILFMANYLASS